jgi:SAM-dependent methyltransferase
MPIGSLSIFPEIVRLTILNAPKKILEVGIGYGINGAGIRNWYNSDVIKRETVIVGIEAHMGYENPLWDCYNWVVEGDVTKMDYVPWYKAVTGKRVSEPATFDVIIMTDVLEHFTDEDAVQVIEKLKSWLTPNGVILISTPAIWIPQEAWEGNEYETHRSFWTRQKLEALGFFAIRDEKYNDPYGHKMLLAEYINKKA